MRGPLPLPLLLWDQSSQMKALTLEGSQPSYSPYLTSCPYWSSLLSPPSLDPDLDLLSVESLFETPRQLRYLDLMN